MLLDIANNYTVHTELEVSCNAVDSVAYFPPEPTVIEPEGGELAASTESAGKMKVRSLTRARYTMV